MLNFSFISLKDMNRCISISNVCQSISNVCQKAQSIGPGDETTCKGVVYTTEYLKTVVVFVSWNRLILS